MEVEADLVMETARGRLFFQGEGRQLKLKLERVSQLTELAQVLNAVGSTGRTQSLLAIDRALRFAGLRLDVTVRERRLVTLGQGQSFGKVLLSKLKL